MCVRERERENDGKRGGVGGGVEREHARIGGFNTNRRMTLEKFVDCEKMGSDACIHSFIDFDFLKMSRANVMTGIVVWLSLSLCLCFRRMGEGGYGMVRRAWGQEE